MRLVFVAGLGHSGSTLLNMLLGTGGKAVPLGQVKRVLRTPIDEAREMTCTCGQAGADCPYWGGALSALDAAGGEASEVARYQILVEHFAKVFGHDLALVDSSKSTGFISKVMDLGTGTPSILQNVKDVRAFVVSTNDSRLKKSGKTAPARATMHNWYLTNKEWDAFRAQKQAVHGRFLYEDLCTKTDATIARINTTLGDDFIRYDGSFASELNHTLSGNRMKTGAVNIRYDTRWMARNDWVWPYALMPWVRRYNQQLYTNA